MLLQDLIPLCVLFAVYLAYRFANTQARTKRGVELIEKQLLDFYSPMFGCIKRIHAQGALRIELSEAADAAWRKICDCHPKSFVDHEKELEPYKKLIEYENEQLSAKIIPLYDRMLEIFTANFWLAEDSTRAHYEQFYQFV